MYSKSVRYASKLEQIRYFIQDNSAPAVGIGSLAMSNCYGLGDHRSPTTITSRWRLLIADFPTETPARKGQAVRVEGVWLLNDERLLIGTVSVLNIVFEKRVRSKFTTDEWNTASEVAAEYVCGIRPKELPPGYDRFAFSVDISTFANLGSKTLYFCVRYDANGQEYWDNNGGKDFRVDFQEIILSYKGKREKDLRYVPETQTSLRRRVYPPTGLTRSNVPEANSNQTIRDYVSESVPAMNGMTLRRGLYERYNFDASLFAATQTERQRPYM